MYAYVSEMQKYEDFQISVGFEIANPQRVSIVSSTGKVAFAQKWTMYRLSYYLCPINWEYLLIYLDFIFKHQLLPALSSDSKDRIILGDGFHDDLL